MYFPEYFGVSSRKALFISEKPMVQTAQPGLLGCGTVLRRVSSQKWLSFNGEKCDLVFSYAVETAEILYLWEQGHLVCSSSVFFRA